MCKNQSNSLLVLYWRSLLGFVSDWRLMEMNHCEVLLGSSADLILRVCSWDSPQRHNYLLQFPQIDCRNIIELKYSEVPLPRKTWHDWSPGPKYLDLNFIFLSQICSNEVLQIKMFAQQKFSPLYLNFQRRC